MLKGPFTRTEWHNRNTDVVQLLPSMITGVDPRLQHVMQFFAFTSTTVVVWVACYWDSRISSCFATSGTSPTNSSYHVLICSVEQNLCPRAARSIDAERNSTKWLTSCRTSRLCSKFESPAFWQELYILIENEQFFHRAQSVVFTVLNGRVWK